MEREVRDVKPKQARGNRVTDTDRQCQYPDAGRGRRADLSGSGARTIDVAHIYDVKRDPCQAVSLVHGSD